jgi:hypothetical protein
VINVSCFTLLISFNTLNASALSSFRNCPNKTVFSYWFAHSPGPVSSSPTLGKYYCHL